MMTEEETGIDDDYIRHHQSWRSSKFNDFINNLDKANDTTGQITIHYMGHIQTFVTLTFKCFIPLGTPT